MKYQDRVTTITHYYFRCHGKGAGRDGNNILKWVQGFHG